MEIQGARNVAIAAIQELVSFSKGYAGTKKSFLSEFEKNSNLLYHSRPTEPMLRNGIRFMQAALEKNIDQNLEDIKIIIKESGEEFLELAEKAQKKIAEIGANRIPEDSSIMIHCHSSTLMNILKKAKEKNIEVICTETRPKFQGRISAQELSKAGLPVTIIVDSAMRAFIKKVDLCLVGADAVCANGAVINKIGTSLMALAAHESRKPFLVCAETYKFDPETALGTLEIIEERDPFEVWEKKIRNLKIRNPAFDATPPEYIDSIITEIGIISPFNVYEVMSREFPYIFKKP